VSNLVQNPCSISLAIDVHELELTRRYNKSINAVRRYGNILKATINLKSQTKMVIDITELDTCSYIIKISAIIDIFEGYIIGCIVKAVLSTLNEVKQHHQQ